VRLGFFILVSFLLPALKEREHEKENARRDDLTGAANRRQFFEAAQAELERFQRYQRPFTIVYFDIDDFKTVNDQQGHQIGDQLLCSVVNRPSSLYEKQISWRGWVGMNSLHFYPKLCRGGPCCGSQVTGGPLGRNALLQLAGDIFHGCSDLPGCPALPRMNCSTRRIPLCIP